MSYRYVTRYFLDKERGHIQMFHILLASSVSSRRTPLPSCVSALGAQGKHQCVRAWQTLLFQGAQDSTARPYRPTSQANGCRKGLSPSECLPYAVNDTDQSVQL